MNNDQASTYNIYYQKLNYFGYRTWLYRRYLAALIDASQLKPGATVLDVGCGQGFFSNLFRKHGMVVKGIDISDVGILSAERAYGDFGISFFVADIQDDALLGQMGQFDCVFARGLSLYNKADFQDNDDVTRRLLGFVKPGGVLIFLYYSNCSSKRSRSWRYHSWTELQHHFRHFPGSRFYFSFKVDAYILGRYAFSDPCTKINRLVSKWSRQGGDLICLVKKSLS